MAGGLRTGRAAWTEAPATLGQLWRQRYRWCYGTMQAMWKHRGAVLEGGTSGKLGRRGLPYLLAFQVLLPLLAPIIDISALYSSCSCPPRRSRSSGWPSSASSTSAPSTPSGSTANRYGPLWSLPLQQIVYRQLMYLVVIQSVASALYGIRLRWHVMRRTGDMDAVPDSAVDEALASRVPAQESREEIDLLGGDLVSGVRHDGQLAERQ